jgi:hypothetical protein
LTMFLRRLYCAFTSACSGSYCSTCDGTHAPVGRPPWTALCRRPAGRAWPAPTAGIVPTAAYGTGRHRAARQCARADLLVELEGLVRTAELHGRLHAEAETDARGTLGATANASRRASEPNGCTNKHTHAPVRRG